RRGRRLGRERRGRPARRQQHRHMHADEFGGEVTQLLIATFRPAKRDHQILPLDKSGFTQAAAERRDHVGRLAGRAAAEKPDHRHRRLLGTRHERPHRRRATEKRDELAPPHSITSSARASSVGGISRPSALAVLRLITSWYVVGAWTGRSAGWAPLKRRST